MKTLLPLAIWLACCGCDNADNSTAAVPASQPAQKADSNTKESVNLPSKHMNSETVAATASNFVSSGARVGDLQVGQSAWIAPWTIWVDADQDAFVNGFHPFSDKPQDDDWVRVVKTADGYEVHMEKSKYKWTPLDIHDVAPGQYNTIPVKKWIYAK